MIFPSLDGKIQGATTSKDKERPMLAHAARAPSHAAHTSKLDLREFERRHYVSVLFERLDDLGSDDHLFIVCGDDPEPLRRKIDDWCPDQFDWSWIGTGPDIWGAELTVRRRPGCARPR
jgi:uncharacterized protein (DUF2249 family)